MVLFNFRVKLALNRSKQEAIAVKIVDHEKIKEGLENVRKEVGNIVYVCTLCYMLYKTCNLCGTQTQS